MTSPLSARLLAIAIGLAVLRAWAADGRQTAFPGDEALHLAGGGFQQADGGKVSLALGRVFEHLQMPAERSSRVDHVESSTFRKAAEYLELDQLSETVLVAAKSVRVGFARNVTIIAGGHVDIAHGAGMVIVAAGNIRISHESRDLDVRPYAGVYITKGELSLGTGGEPIVYAVRGAKTGSSSPITYNTDVRTGSGHRAIPHTRRPLFAGEPVRKPAQPAMTVNSGESMPFKGARCAVHIEAHELFRTLLPAVRRHADCPRIESAEVRCDESTGTGVTGKSNERWTFKLCGREAAWIVRKEPHTREMAPVDRPVGPHYGFASKPPAGQFTQPAGDAGQRRIRLFEEAGRHLVQHELLAARGKYRDAFDITGNDPQALSNLARLEARIARIDAMVARHTSVIESGNATARDFADRGLAYLKAADAGRGLADLRRAVEMNNAAPDLNTDLALGYLHANRLSEADGTARDVTAHHRRHLKAYEVSAWAQILSNSPQQAYGAAFSSLTEAPAWTRERFAADRAAYRVLAGYFALRACAPRARANEWVRRWTGFMSTGNWPDALAFHFIGELDEADVKQIAAGLKEGDEGLALADAHVFLAMEELYGASGDRQKKAMTEFFQTSYRAGLSLPLVISMRILTPGQQLRARDSACS